ncbi:AAA family ATPase [Nocardioides iriomotensis]|uniref:Adenylyl-sulfate kinase n=1 Tax=Nocardioides iriomotensis TaxID=715784 RepID=A0A4Q5IXD2_9ACTN|nr:AAA family ATPase [Nocardioides iriomotensis]RYU09858.1 adenylyl-sulfate kinase [Nocardioides iriomotensis]
MENAPHLIVLRGNAASGKSTLAAALQRALGPGTANVEQDHFRRVILREHDVAGGENIGLIAHTVRYCASIGNNVIVEGILVAKHYRDMLREILAEHPGPTHVFYLDVPLEETLRRHATRPLGAEISADTFREWYVQSDTLSVPGEVVLDGTADLEVTLKVILNRVGDVTPNRDQDGGRYL